MGDTSDDFSFTDRIRSWARAHASNSRVPDSQRTVLPLSNNPPTRQDVDGASSPRPTTTGRKGLSHGSSNNTVAATANNVADATSSAHPPPAPPPNNIQAQGTTPPSIEREKPSGKPSIPTRLKDGSIRFAQHTKNALFHSWANVLLVFVPIGIAVEYSGANSAVIFAMNAVAIVPLAGLLSHATESVASRLGDTLGALLNISFGNAVELIIL